jgi:autotransporter-associated beta strand protein
MHQGRVTGYKLNTRREKSGGETMSRQKLLQGWGRLSLGGRSRILASLTLAIGLLAIPQGGWATSAIWSAATNFDYNTLTNWAGAPASIPGTGAAETASFTNTGVANVGISAATANGVGFIFSNTLGNNYTITVANGVTQGLTDVTTLGNGGVTIARAGTGTVSLAAGAHTFTIGAGQTTTVSSVITGAGNLTKAGTGTLILSGINTYTGLTTVTAGALNLNNNGLALGSLFGNVAVNSGGTFNLNSTDPFSVPTNGVNIFGTGIFNMGAGSTLNTFGGFNVPAGGTLTLAAGSNLFLVAPPPGGLANLGTTIVNGTINGGLTNLAGGFLGGGGIITGALVNNGTVNPGNSPGTLTVGAYTAAANSNTVIEIASAANFDRIIATNAVAGSITLAPGSTVTQTLLNGFIPAINQVLPNVLQATGAGGTVVGSFNTLANQRITRTLFWEAIYNPASVDLQAKANYTFADLNLTTNQMSVGNMLNGLNTVTSGDMFDVLNAINLLTSNGAVGAAYNEISAMKYYYLPTMTFGLTRMQFEGFKSRMARLRWESELDSGSPSAGGSGGGLFRGLNFGYDNKMLLAASTIAVSDAGNPMGRRGVDQRWGIYIEPLFNWGNQSGVPNQVGYRAFSAGFTAGVDFWVTQNLLVGLNTGYSNTDSSIGGTGGNININTIPFNAYGAFSLNGFYVDGILGYTHNNYDMQRNIVFSTINRTATANTGGNQFQLGVDSGYDIKVGNAIFGPMLSVQYATLETQAFTESNAGALNLRVNSQSASSVQTGLGARASYKAKIGNVSVKPVVSVAWQHEYSDNTRGLNASLAQGSSNMTFQTVSNPGKDFVVVGAGVSARFSKRFVANVGYTGELGRSNASNHMLNAGLRFEF